MTCFARKCDHFQRLIFCIWIMILNQLLFLGLRLWVLTLFCQGLCFQSQVTVTSKQINDRHVFLLQWSLVCDHRDWIPTTITSMQMAGVLIGNLACGQIADLVGRKPPLFLALLSLVVLNIITAFSVSWVMFAALRFLIGIAMGFQLTVQYNMTSEFTQTKWRSWVIAVPSWSIQMTLFALVTWLVKDWRWVHIVTAAIGIPLLLTFR